MNWCYHLKPVCQRFFSKDPLLKSANKCTVISMWIQSDAFQSLLQFQTVTIYSRSSRPVNIVDSTICLKRMWPLKNCFLFRRDKNCNNGNYRTVELANHWSADRSVLVDPAVIQSSTNWQALGSLRFVYKSRNYSGYSHNNRANGTVHWRGSKVWSPALPLWSLLSTSIQSTSIESINIQSAFHWTHTT